MVSQSSSREDGKFFLSASGFDAPFISENAYPTSECLTGSAPVFLAKSNFRFSPKLGLRRRRICPTHLERTHKTEWYHEHEHHPTAASSQRNPSRDCIDKMQEMRMKVRAVICPTPWTFQQNLSLWILGLCQLLDQAIIELDLGSHLGDVLKNRAKRLLKPKRHDHDLAQ
jgi:hypothetical protein